MPEPLLRTEALSRSFGSLIAVDRVDMTVTVGELRSIIGPNGAGKTTFFRLISGEMVGNVISSSSLTEVCWCQPG